MDSRPAGVLPPDAGGRRIAFHTLTPAPLRGGRGGEGGPAFAGPVEGSPATPAESTGAMNRYPRRGRVSTKRGFSAESPRASRSRLMALPKP